MQSKPDRIDPTEPPIDPDLEWAITTGFRYLSAGRWLPLLVEFNADVLVRDTTPDVQIPALKVFTALQWIDARLRSAVRVPAIFQKPPVVVDAIPGFHFCTLLVDRDHVREVVADPGWRRTIIEATLGPPLDLADDVPRASDPPDPDPPKPGLWGCIVASARKLLGPRSRPRERALTQVRGGVSGAAVPTTLPTGAVQRAAGLETATGPTEPPVAIAVLDEGIAIAHERFRDGAGTRIGYYWNQNGCAGQSLGNGMPGAELAAADINAALAAHSANGRVDEDLFYQSLAIVDLSADGFKPLMHRRSHGTSVLDLAAGGVPPTSNRPILAVELPAAAIADPVATPLYPYIIMGILYVLERANWIRGDGALPIVLNLSYGPHQGPHDGSSLFERIVDLLIESSHSSATPLDLVLAAGNFRQGRVHAHFTLAANTARTLQWRVQPEDVTPSLLDLWLPANAGSAITVAVTSPLGEAVAVSAAAPLAIFVGPKGEVFRVSYRVPTSRQPRPHVRVTLQGTATDPPLDPTLPTAACGVWSVDVRNTGANELEIEGWIWRDGLGSGRPRGRQSYFDDSTYSRFEVDGQLFELGGRTRLFDRVANPSYVSRGRTLSGIATGRHTYVVGGYRRLLRPDTGTPAFYSSMSPVSGGARLRNAPDLLAPSEDSLVLHGVAVAGTRSGSVVTMNGTSVAAPQVARWLADRVAAGVPTPSPIPGLAGPSFVPPGLVADVAGDGLLPRPSTRMPRR